MIKVCEKTEQPSAWSYLLRKYLFDEVSVSLTFIRHMGSIAVFRCTQTEAASIIMSAIQRTFGLKITLKLLKTDVSGGKKQIQIVFS